MTVVRKEINAAVDKERAAAEAVHGLHRSREEQFAVMLEELLEAKEALDEAEKDLKLMFSAIRRNNDKQAQEFALRVANSAVELSCEAVQLAAVARKELER